MLLRISGCAHYLRAQAYLLHEIFNDRHVKLPQSFRTPVKHTIEAVPVIIKKRRRMIGCVNAALCLLEPWSRIINLHFLYRNIEAAVHMSYREIQIFHPSGSIYAATVSVGLLLIVLASLHINRRIPCEQRKVFYRRKICYCKGQVSYSMDPFEEASPARTIPLFEFFMNSSMVSRSSD